jgi:hypothetical protein
MRVDINKYIYKGQSVEGFQRLKNEQYPTDQTNDVRIACLAHCIFHVNFDIVIYGHPAFIFVFSKTHLWLCRQKPTQRQDCFA